MEIFTVKNLSFRYPDTDENIIDNITFSVRSGDFITVCGPSGCGKSTILKHLKPSLAPCGELSGDILFEGKDINTLSHREHSEKIGFVLQSPDDQIVTDKVWHELAFGLENLGYNNNTIRKRVAEASSFFGIQSWFDSNTNELSGGQKQILNLASVMAMQPSVLILDEPTSQLDPIAASEFISYLSKINRELGITIIITEHRLEEILPISTKILVIENKKIIAYDSPEKAGEILKIKNSKTFLSMPAPMRIWQAVEKEKNKCPVSVTEGQRWLEEYSCLNNMYALYPEEAKEYKDGLAFELKDIWFRYEKNSPDVIKNLSLKVYKGEFVALLGGNGTGKSTAIKIINGTKKAYRGKLKLFYDSVNSTDIIIATLPQNPQALFTKNTVWDDLNEVFDGRKIDKKIINSRINTIISLCKLEKLLKKHPYDLSGGEQQRAALAKILLLKPQILLLDEPTKGIDAEFKIELAQIIKALNDSGITVFMVSHDIEFCAEYAHRCMMFFNGEIISQGTPRSFFSSNSFYVTSSNLMSRKIINNAVTAKDVIYCCTGKKLDETQKINTPDFFNNNNDIIKSELINTKYIKQKQRLKIYQIIIGIIASIALIFGIIINLDYINGMSSKDFPVWFNYLIVGTPILTLMVVFRTKSKKFGKKTKQSNKLSKRTISTLLIVLLAIPATIFFGMTFLQDQKYIFISFLVLIECMIPFFLIFEGRKPKSRELVIISALCAITISGRIIFNMLPQFKPVIALVIISGIAFGGESGFLVGAMSMMVSNIMYGQGAWTPWQMFAAGIIGFLGGVCYKKGFISHSRISLCIFGFIATIVIYGGLMNTYAALSAYAISDIKVFMAFFVQGFPVDIIHGLSTVVFIYFAAEPMLEKLERVKIKYGLIE